ncbi:hypothetical protein LJR289_004235 [Pseudoduganella sp. LjRoot289]|uniref:hypothetical protein n=1 Tax=Pseudoduganella sp. LjRoot289 TaxID=3342314 RepID=UPI003ECD99AD
MTKLKKALDDGRLPSAPPAASQMAEDTIEARRARRMAALKRVAGIWKDRPDIPADGLEYQRAMRAEWP